MIVAWTVSQRGVLIPDIVCISFSIHISVIFRVKERGSKIFTWKFRNLSMDYVTQHVIIWPNENIWWFKPLTFIYKSKPNKNFFRHLQFLSCKLSSGGILLLFPFKLGVSENWRADVNRQQFRCGTQHIFGSGWQKLRCGTGGPCRKVWTRKKILSPNLRYFVTN